MLFIDGAWVSAASGATFASRNPATGETLGEVADGGAEDAANDYTATIDWGDGTTSTGTISGPDQSGVFTVTGTQTYAEAGSFTINVTLTHEGAPSVTVTDTAAVSDALLAINAPQE